MADHGNHVGIGPNREQHTKYVITSLQPIPAIFQLHSLSFELMLSLSIPSRSINFTYKIEHPRMSLFYMPMT